MSSRNFLSKFLYLLLLSASACGAPVESVALRGLDKYTSKVLNMNVPVGSKVKFGSLEIQVLQADCNPPELRPECKARLRILEKGQELFKDWMFASDPAVSALEHRVYDVWVVVP